MSTTTKDSTTTDSTTTDSTAKDTTAGSTITGTGRGIRPLWIVGFVAALLLAGLVSYYASASPDGLEKVAADKGIDSKVADHAAKDSPLADYRAKDVGNPRLAGGLAGVIGVGATLAVGTGVFWVVRRRGAGAEG